MRATLSSLLLLGVLAATGRPAAAENPNVAFSGRIMVSDHRFPQTAKSPSAYTALIRKQAKANFVEDKASKTWKIYFAGFLKTPLNDLEYVIKLYDVSGHQQSVVVSFDQFTDERGQKTITSNMTLEEKQVGVNRELMMTMESKGKVLASTRFKIIGEGEKFTGKVNFSDDDAAGKDE